MRPDVDPNQDFDAGPVTQPEIVAPPVVVEKQPEVVPQEQTQAVAKVSPIRQPLAATETGLLVGTTLEEQYRLAQYYCRSGLMPAALQTPEKVLVALQLCRELNLPPMSSIGKVMVLNGTPSIFGDLPLALVRKSGKLKSIAETSTRDEKGEITSATCTVVRVDGGVTETIERTFTVEDAKRARLWNKTSRDGKPTPWVLYPARMMQMRARSWALKDAFADVLAGVNVAEYDNNAIVENGKVIDMDGEIPVQTVAAELNDKFLDKGENGGTTGADR